MFHRCKTSPWYSVRAGADYLQYSNRHCRRLISYGQLKAYKLPNGGLRLHKSDLDAFVVFGKPFNKLTTPQKEIINEAKNI